MNRRYVMLPVALLCAVLAWSASQKFISLAAGSLRGKSLEVTMFYSLAAVVELSLSGLVLVPRLRTVAAAVCGGTFAGIGVARAVEVLRLGFRRPCACLGDVPISHGGALILAGATVSLAGFVLALARTRDRAVAMS